MSKHNLGRFYNHDVNHYRFARQLDDHSGIEEHKTSSYRWAKLGVLLVLAMLLVQVLRYNGVIPF
jgi:hypothetical protein